MCFPPDALVLEKAITDEPVLPENDREQITVRVQSSTKSVSYRLCKVSSNTSTVHVMYIHCGSLADNHACVTTIKYMSKLFAEINLEYL